MGREVQALSLFFFFPLYTRDGGSLQQRLQLLYVSVRQLGPASFRGVHLGQVWVRDELPLVQDCSWDSLQQAAIGREELYM